MATNDYGFFFNSINGDRVYDADSFSTWLRKFFTSGVFEGELAVTAADGMAVEVGSGYANVDGKVRFFNSPQTIALSPANSTYPRIDTIVVERNDVAREIVLKYITGQYSGNTPSPAERQWGNGVYQLVLAQIYVGAGVTSISQANIADTRPDSSLCGYVVGTVEEINLSQILAQSQEQFAEWFDRMKDQLSEDAAGNLQLEIDSINDVLYDREKDGAFFRKNLTVYGSAVIIGSLSTQRVNAPSGVYIGNDRGFYAAEKTSGTPVRLLQLNSDNVCVVGHNDYDTNILGKTTISDNLDVDGHVTAAGDVNISGTVRGKNYIVENDANDGRIMIRDAGGVARYALWMSDSNIINLGSDVSSISTTIRGGGGITLAGATTISGNLSNTGAISAGLSVNATTGVVAGNGHGLYVKNASGSQVKLFWLTSGNVCTVGSDDYATSILGKTITASKTITVSSDRRLKRDITVLDGRHRAIFDRLRPVSYRLREDEDGKEHIGFVAQEVQEALEQSGLTNSALVQADSEGMLSIGYTELIGLLIDEVQTLKARVKALEEKIAVANHRISDLEDAQKKG